MMFSLENPVTHARVDVPLSVECPFVKRPIDEMVKKANSTNKGFRIAVLEGANKQIKVCTVDACLKRAVHAQSLDPEILQDKCERISIFYKWPGQTEFAKENEFSTIEQLNTHLKGRANAARLNDFATGILKTCQNGTVALEFMHVAQRKKPQSHLINYRIAKLYTMNRYGIAPSPEQALVFFKKAINLTKDLDVQWKIADKMRALSQQEDEDDPDTTALDRFIATGQERHFKMHLKEIMLNLYGKENPFKKDPIDTLAAHKENPAKLYENAKNVALAIEQLEQLLDFENLPEGLAHYKQDLHFALGALYYFGSPQVEKDWKKAFSHFVKTVEFSEDDNDDCFAFIPLLMELKKANSAKAKMPEVAHDMYEMGMKQLYGSEENPNKSFILEKITPNLFHETFLRQDCRTNPPRAVKLFEQCLKCRLIGRDFTYDRRKRLEIRYTLGIVFYLGAPGVEKDLKRARDYLLKAKEGDKHEARVARADQIINKINDELKDQPQNGAARNEHE